MMRHEIRDRKGHITCKLFDNDPKESQQEISECEISIDRATKTWNITAWFTKEGFGNMGLGGKTLKIALEFCLGHYGYPSLIQYTWNGANEYVLKWLESHFDAVCNCPIAVQKTQSDDDWDSHVYDLNVLKVLDYFDIPKKKYWASERSIHGESNT